jgi:hypothetical protein
MAGGKRGVSDTSGSSGSAGPRRRRSPPTIDLKATEVIEERETPPVQAEEPQASPAHSETAAAEEGGRTNHDTKGDDDGAAPLASAAPESAAVRASAVWRGLGPRWQLGAAASAGATAMLLLVALLWAAGIFDQRDSDTAVMAAKLAVLELQVRDLAARAPAAATDSKALGDLGARLSGLEQKLTQLGDISARARKLDDLDARLGKLESGMAAPLEHLTAIDARLKALDESIAGFRQRVEASDASAREAHAEAVSAAAAAGKATAQAGQRTAERGDLDALAARVDQVERAAKAARERPVEVNAGNDRAARFAIIAAALRDAVDQGTPYTAELAAAKPLVADAATLAPLEPFAASGLPTVASLAAELSKLASAQQPSDPGTGGGLVDRLQAQAARVVRVRRLDEPPHDDGGMILARARAAAAAGNIDTARAELAQLPAEAQAPVKAWIERAAAYVAARAAARRLMESALTALQKGLP